MSSSADCVQLYATVHQYYNPAQGHAPALLSRVHTSKIFLTMFQIFFAYIRGQHILFVDVACTLRQVVEMTALLGGGRRERSHSQVVAIPLLEKTFQTLINCTDHCIVIFWNILPISLEYLC